ncbi:hypothetical protein DY000_02016377 [Brassica cretica]|uniref:MADS-box domain-containing protein n=1 Tax=Brassica cretica TaxID=69181 RepID=A0ABQ7CUZ6_BRACR|nr:hypothetical protein DY000_02016377 [Brassica cretica]
MDWSSTIPRSSESTKREHSKKSKTLLTTDDADPDDDTGQDSPEELDGNTLSSLSNLDNMNRYVTKDHTRRIRRKCQMVLRGRETMWICNENAKVLTTKFAGAATTTLLVASSSAPPTVLPARPLATSSSMPPSAPSSTASPPVLTMPYSYPSTTPFVNNREKCA